MRRISIRLFAAAVAVAVVLLSASPAAAARASASCTQPDDDERSGGAAENEGSTGAALANAPASIEMAPTRIGEAEADIEAAPEAVGWARGGPRGIGAALIERLVRQFDFNEPDNPLPIPKYWVRIDDVGFPEWNRIGFVPARPDPAATPPIDRTYRLQTQGGSAGIRLVGGVMAAIPMTDYLITARIRTEAITRARARIVVRFIDSHGVPLEGSQASSDPLITNGRWEQVQARLIGRHPEAAWLQIDLLLEQEDRWRDVGPELPIHLQDVTGAAEFDDVTVWRLPRVELIASDTNIIEAPNPVEINIHVQDLSRDQMNGTLRLFDHRGELIGTTEVTLLNRPGAQRWNPGVTEFGWYRAILDLYEDGRPIARAGADFAYLPARAAPPAGETPSFSIAAETEARGRLDLIPQLVGPLPIDRVTLPLWDSDVDFVELEAHRDALNAIVERLVASGLDVGLSINRLPKALATELALSMENVIEALLDSDDTTWRWLQPYLISYGQRVRQWSISATPRDALAARSTIMSDVSSIIRRLGELVPNPELRAPWSMVYEPPTLSASNESLRFVAAAPSASVPESISHYVARWNETGAPYALRLNPIDMERYGGEAVVTDFVKRAALAIEAGATEVELQAPWTFVGARFEQAMPTALYPAIRTVITHLAHRKAVGRINFGGDIVAIIFRDQTGAGCLVMWNDSDDAAEVSVSMLLGASDATAVDAYGNQTPIPVIDGGHRLTVGREPIFVTGVDIPLAQFRAGFRVVPEFVEASATLHAHEIVLTNPWPETIHGRVLIEEPATWRFDKRFTEFELAPGKEFRAPLVFSYPLNELAGDKSLVAIVELGGAQQIRTRLEAPLRIGLRGATLQPTYRFVTHGEDGGPPDLIVTHEVTNHAEKQLWLVTYAVAPGLRYQEASIANLLPGETVIRSFYFPGAGDLMRGRSMRVGMREMDDSGRLNLELKIE